MTTGDDARHIAHPAMPRISCGVTPSSQGYSAGSRRDAVLLRTLEVGRFGQDAADYAVMMARFARDFPRHVRHPVPPDAAIAAVQHRLRTREQRFLGFVERIIYGHAGSPYRALLRMAGCEFGDLRRSVDADGVEGTLRTLADQGVYVAFDEMQGRRAVVRGSFRLAVRADDFENPMVRPHLSIFSGGSGGRPRRIRSSLPLLREWATSIATVFAAYDIDRPRWAFWWTLPATWLGVSSALGQPVAAWFHPVDPHPVAARLMSRYLATLGRLAGYPIPRPRFVDATNPQHLVGWLADALAISQPLVMLATPSAAVRLAMLVREHGAELRNLSLLIVGEPITDARRREIEASGARVIPSYSSTDAAGISYGCATPAAADDVHLMLDRFALITRERAPAPGSPSVPAGLVTSLSVHSSRIALNAELGDAMHVEERDCGCYLGVLGLRTHLSDIRSFEKLTGEGVTFALSRLVQILEEVLPRRFGGNSLDYQMVEEETAEGTTRMVLRVHPAVGAIDEADLCATFLHELGRGSAVDRFQANVWRTAGTIEIRREPPLATRAGKVLPFQSRRRAEAPS